MEHKSSNMTPSSAQAYSMELANTLTKITMEKFFKKIHNRFYHDQDVSFMKYFLELTQHEGEFVVPHTDLVEYGVVTSTRSNKILDKLIQLNLEKDEDYRLHDVVQPVKQGGFVTHKVYHLTPNAFKKCLMRAQRRPKQEVDPVIYCDYYLLLERVFKLYTDYERQYAKCLLTLKDDKIDTLNAKVDQQSLEIRQLLTRTDHIIVQNDQQSIVLKQQSVTLEQQSFEIQQLTYKIDTLFEYLLSFAHMTMGANMQSVC